MGKDDKDLHGGGWELSKNEHCSNELAFSN